MQSSFKLIKYRDYIKQALKRSLPKRDEQITSLWDTMERALYLDTERIEELVLLILADSLPLTDDVRKAIESLSIGWGLTKAANKLLFDLPALDNQPGLHNQTTQANALLAADALHTYAHEYLIRHCPASHCNLFIQELSKITGHQGVLGHRSQNDLQQSTQDSIQMIKNILIRDIKDSSITDEVLEHIIQLIFDVFENPESSAYEELSEIISRFSLEETALAEVIESL